MAVTRAASKNEDSKGARKAPKMRNTLTFWKESNRSGVAQNRRMHTAPIRASELLLANHPRTIARGTPLCSSAARCAGKAAAIRSPQEDTGDSSKAASSKALGSHRVEIGCG